jgi:hypothetical protein
MEVGCDEPEAHFHRYERALFRCWWHHVWGRPPKSVAARRADRLMPPPRSRPFREEGALFRPNKFRCDGASHYSLFRGSTSIPAHIFVLLLQFMGGTFS